MLDNDAIESRKPRTAKWRWLQNASVLIILGVVAIGFAVLSQRKECDITDTIHIPKTNVDIVVTHPEGWVVKQSFWISKPNYFSWEIKRKPSNFIWFQYLINGLIPATQTAMHNIDLEIIVCVSPDLFQAKERDKVFSNWKSSRERSLASQNPDTEFKFGKQNSFGDDAINVIKSSNPGPYPQNFVETKEFRHLWNDKLNASWPVLTFQARVQGKSIRSYEPFIDKLATQIYLKPHDENAQPK